MKNVLWCIWSAMAILVKRPSRNRVVVSSNPAASAVVTLLQSARVVECAICYFAYCILHSFCHRVLRFFGNEKSTKYVLIFTSFVRGAPALNLRYELNSDPFSPVLHSNEHLWLAWKCISIVLNLVPYFVLPLAMGTFAPTLKVNPYAWCTKYKV